MGLGSVAANAVAKLFIMMLLGIIKLVGYFSKANFSFFYKDINNFQDFYMLYLRHHLFPVEALAKYKLIYRNIFGQIR